MQKITPHLWFNREAEEAVRFYTSVFNNSEVLSTTHYPEAGYDVHGMPAGTVLTVEFKLEGEKFLALNGGPHFKINPSISFMVHCPSAEEVDALFEKLSVGGTALMPLDTYPFSKRYGWIQDKYGVSWQLIFTELLAERQIIPSLMFVGDQCGRAEEAASYYASVFKDSSIGEIAHYGAGQAPNVEGTVMYAELNLAGQKFTLMDSAGPHEFAFNEAVSLLVTCQTQEEINYFWEKLSAVPEAEQCGWVKDKFGVSWQIAPAGIEKMLNDPDAGKANRVMEAMLQMKKIDMAALNAAYAEES